MCDNEIKTKENIIWTKDKVKPQHIVLHVDQQMIV